MNYFSQSAENIKENRIFAKKRKNKKDKGRKKAY